MIFVLSTGKGCHWQNWANVSDFIFQSFFVTLKCWKNEHVYKLDDNGRNWGFNYKTYTVYILFLDLHLKSNKMRGFKPLFWFFPHNLLLF